MAENITVKLAVEVLPFGTVRVTERVLFEVAGANREKITEASTTAASESVATSLPYLLR